MNRVVREHYPVSKLPDDLRVEFAGLDEVTVTVERSFAASTDLSSVRASQSQSLEELFSLAVPSFASLDEVAAHVRSLRDEWT